MRKRSDVHVAALLGSTLEVVSGNCPSRTWTAFRRGTNATSFMTGLGSTASRRGGRPCDALPRSSHVYRPARRSDNRPNSTPAANVSVPLAGATSAGHGRGDAGHVVVDRHAAPGRRGTIESDGERCR